MPTKATLRLLAAIAAIATGTFARAADQPRGPECLVKAIKVLPDKAPDSSSLRAMVESITRDCKCNDDKMVAIDNFMRISHYHRAYPPGSPSLLWFNNYGWSLCGGLANLQGSLYSQVPGWSWRMVGGAGHNMSEAKYDGSWHWVDCFLKFYTWRPDPKALSGRTIASHDDIKADPKIVSEALFYDEAEKVVYAKNNRKEMIGGKLNWMAPALLVCGDDIPGVLLQARKRHLEPECTTPDPRWVPAGYSAEVNLRPGMSLENTWEQLTPPAESWPIKDKFTVGHDCGNKDLCNDPVAGPVWEPWFHRIRSYWNGRLVCAPDFSSKAVMQSFVRTENARYENGAIVPQDAKLPGSVTVALDSPFLVVKASGIAEGADKVEVSVDGGKGFFGADLKSLTAVKDRTSVWVKISFKTALKSLRIEEIVMNNAGVLPYLSPGKNKVSVAVANPQALGENKLVVTYAFAPGYRDKSFEDLYKEHKPLFTQQYAHWATQPTVVQKIYTSKDLPASFEINVPTPKGKFPVYPRMLFLRREVLSANGKPLPLPQGAQTPKMDAGDELKTLPNPYLVGTQPPPQAPAGRGQR